MDENELTTWVTTHRSLWERDSAPIAELIQASTALAPHDGKVLLRHEVREALTNKDKHGIDYRIADRRFDAAYTARLFLSVGGNGFTIRLKGAPRIYTPNRHLHEAIRCLMPSAGHLRHEVFPNGEHMIWTGDRAAVLNGQPEVWKASSLEEVERVLFRSIHKQLQSMAARAKQGLDSLNDSGKLDEVVSG